jgi:hypothetical protein
MTTVHRAAIAVGFVPQPSESADPADGRFAPIVLKKSVLADEQNFLRPLMRFALGDVRDLIVLHKNDHGPSYRPYRALQR